jgi:methylase of polypeptide subunit release factors
MRFVKSGFRRVEGVLTDVNDRANEIAEENGDIKEAQISIDEIIRWVGSVDD